MAQQPSDRDKLDFTSLTDAIIPSNLYLNSWNETGQPRSLGTQTFPSGLNMFPPTFGSIPLSDTQGSSEPVANTATENHTAFSANALQQFDADTHGQDRGVGNTLNTRSQTDHPPDRNGPKISGPAAPVHIHLITLGSFGRQGPTSVNQGSTCPPQDASKGKCDGETCAKQSISFR